jgi:hypothetical protein
MRRSVSVMLLLLATLGASLVAMLPAAAQAATAARPFGFICTPPAAVRHLTLPDGVVSAFTGCTYPDTSAGLAACDAMGVYEAQHGSLGYVCSLGDPDPGVYNLWVRTWV